MEEQELRNFLRSEGEDANEAAQVAVPPFDINSNLLQDICDGVESDGLGVLVQNFGTIANTFKTQNDFACGVDLVEEAIKVINASIVRLHMEIVAAQKNVKISLVKVERQLKHKFRKYMAVLFFLIYKSFTEIERAVAAEAHNLSIANAAKQNSKRKKKGDADDMEGTQYRFWFDWRSKIVEGILKLTSPPMDEIWEGAPDGVNFMRCLTLAFCVTIKNKTKNMKTMDAETEDIFEILGVLAAKHQEEKGIMSRLIPLLKGSEETANIIANGIHKMITKVAPDQAQNVVLHALTETLDVYMSSLQKETTADRGFHAFLTQLCSLEQKGALHSLAVIVQFLESESQIVRNAVLIVASELMNWIWSQMHEPDGEQRTADEQRDERRRLSDNWLPIRKKLLNEILLYHMRDTNALVRSKATNLLTEIVRQHKLTPGESVELMKNVKLRLLDKTVTARKHATTLVIDLVKLYPHMVRPAEEFERKITEKRQEIVSCIQHDEKDPAISLYFIIKEFHLHLQEDSYRHSVSIKEQCNDLESTAMLMETLLNEGRYWEACDAFTICLRKWSNQTALQEALARFKANDDDSDNQPDEHLYLCFFKNLCPKIFPQELSTLELDELNYIASNKVEACREFLPYLQSCYKMKTELERCQPSLRKLLELGTTTDKKEAVMFYAAICEAGYVPPQPITVSIINALGQLNAEELHDFVEPFRQIFIGREVGPAAFVRKLLELVKDLPESQVESVSGMIGELYRSNRLTNESIQILWDAFSLSTGGWSTSESRSAAYVLGIIGQIERDIITSNLTRLINTGLGKRGIEDYELAKATLQTILFGCRVEQEFVEPEVPKGRSKGPKPANPRNKTVDGIKFPPTHDLFTKIVDLIECGLKVEGDDTMTTMYPRVVELSIQMIYRMCTEPTEIVMKFLPNIHGLVFGVGEIDDPFKTSEKILFRYMSFGKALLGSHINYYEQSVSKDIKQRKASLTKFNKKNNVSNKRGARDSKATGNSFNSSIMNQSNQDAASEMDLMIGNIGFDSEAEAIKNYVTKLLDQGFFRQFRLHVFYLCTAFDKIVSLNLKVTCVQALAKLMMVSEASVTKSISQLIKLWSGSEPFAVKLEILRASIRLTVRFPNQMEKINEQFSSGLADKDSRVRKACMDYIQYLALSDLLKVREQLSDTAACLCDPSYELREMARDFINEISEKDNILQNTIPDIISRLSSRDDISQDDFRNIMKTLLSKIKKEKQLGGLVERIVGRFKGPITSRVSEDTAFCLTQIQQNEKTLKILKDSITFYSDKLGNDYVWECFTDVLGAIRKLSKPELKIKIDEWEKELNEHRAKCLKLQNAETAGKRKNQKVQIEPVESSDEDEEEVESNDPETVAGNPNPVSPTRAARKSPRNKASAVSSEAEDENDNDSAVDSEEDEEMAVDPDSEED